MSRHQQGPVLVVRTPRGRLEHPVLPGTDVCTIVARLAPFVPDGTWSVTPATDITRVTITGPSAAQEGTT